MNINDDTNQSVAMILVCILIHIFFMVDLIDQHDLRAVNLDTCIDFVTSDIGSCHNNVFSSEPDLPPL